MSTELATQDQTKKDGEALTCSSPDGFAHIQRVATMWSKSALLPKEFQGNIPNIVIGLEMASRMKANPLSVFQNLYIVRGKPGWSSQFIIAAVNATKKFTPLRFEMTGKVNTDERTCVAWANDASGERLESPPVSIGIARKEGWIDKDGSKWKTMPELMLRYRAATFFGRLYAPEILMGMKSAEEIEDVEFSERPKNDLPAPGRVGFAKVQQVKIQEDQPSVIVAETFDEHAQPETPEQPAMSDTDEKQDFINSTAQAIAESESEMAVTLVANQIDNQESWLGNDAAEQLRNAVRLKCTENEWNSPWANKGNGNGKKK